MTTRVYSHPACVRHDPGDMHPECSGRLESVLAALSGHDFEELQWMDAPLADAATVKLAHGDAYVDQILDNVPTSGRVYLDPDTAMNPDSGEAALRAVGAACAAVDAVIAGDVANAFCAVRPPGHHAEYDRAMGFCLFNTVSVAARHGIATHGLNKIAVVDFDVHHGNGTQHAFYDDENLFFGSSHQMPAYPGTGARTETGAEHTNCNVPLPPGAGSREFRAAWNDEILGALEAFSPELIIISAGFDAHESDPLAQLEVKTEDYGWITSEIMDVADRVCEGRVISSLEGGYDLPALGRNAAEHVRALMTA